MNFTDFCAENPSPLNVLYINPSASVCLRISVLNKFSIGEVYERKISGMGQCGGVKLVGFGWKNLKYDLENEKLTFLIMYK